MIVCAPHELMQQPRRRKAARARAPQAQPAFLSPPARPTCRQKKAVGKLGVALVLLARVPCSVGEMVNDRPSLRSEARIVNGGVDGSGARSRVVNIDEIDETWARQLGTGSQVRKRHLLLTLTELISPSPLERGDVEPWLASISEFAGTFEACGN